MSRSRKRSRKYSCSYKRVHYDFWTAMQQCISLEKIEPLAAIRIYHCDFCGNIHITTGRAHKNKYKILKALAANLRAMTPEWWLKAPPKAIDRRITYEILLLKKAFELGCS